MADPSSPASALSSEFLTASTDEALVATFDSVMEAELARGRLEVEGIGARLFDASPAAVYGPVTAGGTVKLWVARENLEAARTILFAPSALTEPFPEESAPALMKLDASAEDLALRAFRASVLGFIIVPPVLHIYSLVLAARAAGAPGDLSPKSRRRLAVAVLFDTAACAIAGAVAWALTH